MHIPSARRQAQKFISRKHEIYNYFPNGRNISMFVAGNYMQIGNDMDNF